MITASPFFSEKSGPALIQKDLVYFFEWKNETLVDLLFSGKNGPAVPIFQKTVDQGPKQWNRVVKYGRGLPQLWSRVYLLNDAQTVNFFSLQLHTLQLAN